MNQSNLVLEVEIGAFTFGLFKSPIGVFESRVLNPKTTPELKKEKVVVKVPSNSTPDIYYTVEVYPDGHTHCDCDGWKYRRTCSHSRGVISVIRELNKS